MERNYNFSYMRESSSYNFSLESIGGYTVDEIIIYLFLRQTGYEDVHVFCFGFVIQEMPYKGRDY